MTLKNLHFLEIYYIVCLNDITPKLMKKNENTEYSFFSDYCIIFYLTEKLGHMHQRRSKLIQDQWVLDQVNY